MENIDDIRINFNPDQLLILNLCLGFLMFGVALDLRPDQFWSLLQKPRKPLIGLFSQWVLLPVLTLGLIVLFRPAPSLALGMLLVSVCPGGNVSNFAVHLAGANAALSVMMTTVSTLGAVVLTPFLFVQLAPLVLGGGGNVQAISVPFLDIVSTIVQLVLIPLLLGMALNHRFPEVTEKIRKPVRYFSLAIFVGFVLVALYSNYENISRYLKIVFLLVLVHNAAALLCGYWFAKLNGLVRYDARAISIETGIQNSGLGLILIFNFFDGLGGMALIAAWWGIWHLISVFFLSILWSKIRVFEKEEIALP